MSRPLQSAVALEHDTIVLLDAGGSVRRFPLDDAPTDGAAWTALEAALRALSGDREGETLHLALLTPWCEVRGLTLPPIDDADLVQLVARGGPRYFVAARGPQVVGLSPQPRGAPAGAPRMVAASSARVIAGLEAAARAAGWTGVRIVPAEAAWAASTSTIWAARTREQVGILIATADRTTLVESVGGDLSGIRRFRAGDRDAPRIAEHARSGLALAVVGSEPFRSTLVRALAPHGVVVQSLPESWNGLGADPAALAASFAEATRGPVLASASAVQATHARVRRLAWKVATAAVVTLVAAAAVELWGAQRELAAVQAARREVRPAVDATLVGRSSLEEAYRRLVEVVDAERQAPRWSVVLADLAARVPVEAHLTGFRSRGDSLVLDGFAVSAAELFAALEQSPALANVRASAPVRRQAPEGADPMERFTISALRRPLRSEAP